jgi:hypothetical protein
MIAVALGFYVGLIVVIVASICMAAKRPMPEQRLVFGVREGRELVNRRQIRIELGHDSDPIEDETDILAFSA